MEIEITLCDNKTSHDKTSQITCKGKSEIENMLKSLKMKMWLNNNILYRKSVKKEPTVRSNYFIAFEG